MKRRKFIKPLAQTAGVDRGAGKSVGRGGRESAIETTGKAPSPLRLTAVQAGMTRREMLRLLAVAAPLGLVASSAFAVEPAGRKRLGIGMHSYGFHWKAARDDRAVAKFSDALGFLQYARQLGAGGVQVIIGSRDDAYARQIRTFTERSGMYFEAQTTLPREKAEVVSFEADVRLARVAGAEVMRTALLSGRRYETFDSAEAFRQFRAQALQSLALAEPILRRHRLRLAVENHKDHLAGELVELLRKLSSPWVGACVDFGNNLALLEEPMSVVEALAPFALSTHIKDMAVQECAEGFLLSEVPLGEGFLDLRAIVAALLKANPKIQFNLEMITRDALKIPCLTEKYWATMRDAPAQRLASALAVVHRHASKDPLPRITGLSTAAQLAAEDGNVRKSVAYANGTLGL